MWFRRPWSPPTRSARGWRSWMLLSARSVEPPTDQDRLMATILSSGPAPGHFPYPVEKTSCIRTFVRVKWGHDLRRADAQAHGARAGAGRARGPVGAPGEARRGRRAGRARRPGVRGVPAGRGTGAEPDSAAVACAGPERGGPGPARDAVPVVDDPGADPGVADLGR